MGKLYPQLPRTKKKKKNQKKMNQKQRKKRKEKKRKEKKRKEKKRKEKKRKEKKRKEKKRKEQEQEQEQEREKKKKKKLKKKKIFYILLSYLPKGVTTEGPREGTQKQPENFVFLRRGGRERWGKEEGEREGRGCRFLARHRICIPGGWGLRKGKKERKKEIKILFPPILFLLSPPPSLLPPLLSPPPSLPPSSYLCQYCPLKGGNIKRSQEKKKKGSCRHIDNKSLEGEGERGGEKREEWKEKMGERRKGKEGGKKKREKERGGRKKIYPINNRENKNSYRPKRSRITRSFKRKVK